MRIIDRIKNISKALKSYIILALCVSAIYLLVCARHSIYPFGNSSVAREDFAGMIVPSYTFIWDVMHGKASLFWDWYTGLGQGMMGVVVHFDLLSPFNILFYLWDRSELKYMMTYFILIKIIFISWSMYYFLNKMLGPLDKYMSIFYSMLYALSGFVLQNMETPSWLEAVMLYPMLMIGIYEIVKKKRFIKYTLVLSMIMILSIEQSYMFVLSIILLFFAYFIFISKNEQGSIIASLAIGTMISFLIAAPVFIPGAYQVVHSYRLASRGTFVDIMQSIDYSNRFKWLMLMNMQVPIAVIIMYLIRNIKSIRIKIHGKRCYFLAFMLMVLALPIVIEASNIMWSAGSYVNFPMRFAYMLEFWILFVSLIIYKRLRHGIEEKMLFNNRFLVPISIVVQPIFCFIEYWILTNYKGMVWIIFLIIAQACSLLPLLEWKIEFVNISIGILIFVQCLMLTNVYLLPSVQECTPSLLSFEEYEELFANVESRSPLERIKCYDGNQDSNYPVLIRRSAQSSYMHLVSKEQIIENKMLGYTSLYTRLSDVGGTIFSDMVIGVKDVFSKKENILSQKLYKKVGYNQSFNAYSTNNYYNEGILIDRDDINAVDNISENIVDNQNNLSKLILGEKLFDNAKGKVNNNKVDIKIDGEQCLYYYNNSDGNVAFYINDEKVDIYDRNSNSTYYPSMWNNGCVLLGTFKDEIVHLKVIGSQKLHLNSFFTMDMDLLSNATPCYAESYKAEYKNAGISIDLNVFRTDQVLFLPISADDGWKCKVNGKYTEIEKIYFDSFIGIPLEKGKNIVELVYIPKGFQEGVILMAIAFLFIVLGLIGVFDYRFILKCRPFQKITTLLFMLISVMVLAIVYVCPVIGMMLNFISKIS